MHPGCASLPLAGCPVGCSSMQGTATGCRREGGGLGKIALSGLHNAQSSNCVQLVLRPRMRPVTSTGLRDRGHARILRKRQTSRGFCRPGSGRASPGRSNKVVRAMLPMQDGASQVAARDALRAGYPALLWNTTGMPRSTLPTRTQRRGIHTAERCRLHLPGLSAILWMRGTAQASNVPAPDQPKALCYVPLSYLRVLRMTQVRHPS